jgi:hypothetical protein
MRAHAIHACTHSVTHIRRLVLGVLLALWNSIGSLRTLAGARLTHTQVGAERSLVS